MLYPGELYRLLGASSFLFGLIVSDGAICCYSQRKNSNDVEVTDLFHMLDHYCIQTSVWSGLKYHIRGQDCACDYRKHF
jgi:hypothetical protein